MNKKTVKVRIAVAVDSEGDWNASGWGNGSDISDYSLEAKESAMDLCIEGVADGEARYWITAVLEVPEDQEIEAEIEKA